MNDTTDALPPLPEPDGRIGAAGHYCRVLPTDDLQLQKESLLRWSADKLRAYGASCYRAALAAQQGAQVPQGWKLVPVEPTTEQMKAGGEWATFPHACYRAMLSASPQAPAQQQEKS